MKAKIEAAAKVLGRAFVVGAVGGVGTFLTDNGLPDQPAHRRGRHALRRRRRRAGGRLHDHRAVVRPLADGLRARGKGVVARSLPSRLFLLSLKLSKRCATLGSGPGPLARPQSSRLGFHKNIRSCGPDTPPAPHGSAPEGTSTKCH